MILTKDPGTGTADCNEASPISVSKTGDFSQWRPPAAAGPMDCQRSRNSTGLDFHTGPRAGPVIDHLYVRHQTHILMGQQVAVQHELARIV